MAKKQDNFDPFARRLPIEDTGVVSDRPNDADKENEKIKPFIPQDASTDEGYEKMLRILKQSDPSPEDHQETNHKENSNNTPSNSNTPESAEAFTGVKENEFPKEEILPLLDALLMKGIIRESFTIRGAKVTFRTQFFWEDQLAMKLTDEQLNSGSLRTTGALVNSLYVLSMNLEEFGGNYFKPISRGTPGELRESLEERAAFLQTLPTVLVNYLWDKRTKFFQKVEYISKHFEELIKDF